jgi:hypothetical protein
MNLLTFPEAIRHTQVKIKLHLLLILLFLSPTLMAQEGLRGRVIDEEGSPLSFTTIFIKETGSGSISNLNGTYEIKLEPGTYNLNFQHLGYGSVQEQVNILPGKWLEKDIVLQKQAYLLSEANIQATDEDPAYKIMRKVIAKTAFHRQQVESYTCKVYLKGGGRLIDYPWFMKKVIEEEGIDTAATFVQESISEISFQRPATYTEKVISIRTVGDDRNTSPMNYINGSFYEDRVAGLVSPLSRKAFAYYRFRYINTFEDRGYQINQIEVIPRVDDEEFVKGNLYVVEGLWNLHSIDFQAIPQGISIDIEQNFAPVEPEVWLPISHQYQGKGKLFGFEFSFQYLATVSDYEIELNPDLDQQFEVIDEKTEMPEPEEEPKSFPLP